MADAGTMMVTRSISRRTASVAVLATTLSLAGCATPTEEGVEDDVEPAGVDEFWAPMVSGAASEVEYYESIEDLSASASAVVRGRIVEAGPGRVVQGDADIDRFTTRHLLVDVAEALAGELVVDGRQVTVEVIQPVGATPPEDEVILFLRWSPDVGFTPPEEVIEAVPELAEMYTLANSQGVWVDVGGDAANPLLEGDGASFSDPVVASVGERSFEELAATVAEVEASGRPSSFQADAPTEG